MDGGWTQYPNIFWRYYHKVIKRQHWLFVCHLATYKYESEQGKCKPSLRTIAKEMGYKDRRQVQNLRGELECIEFDGVPFLRVYYQEGDTNVYNFAGLSQCLSYLAKGGEIQITREAEFTTVARQVSPPGEHKITPGAIPDSPKEESEETQQLRRVWSQCLQELEMQVTKAVFERHYKTSRLLSCNGIAVIACRDPEWMTAYETTRVQRTLASVTGQGVAVRFEEAGNE